MQELVRVGLVLDGQLSWSVCRDTPWGEREIGEVFLSGTQMLRILADLLSLYLCSTFPSELRVSQTDEMFLQEHFVKLCKQLR